MAVFNSQVVPVPHAFKAYVLHVGERVVHYVKYRREPGHQSFAIGDVDAQAPRLGTHSPAASLLVLPRLRS